MNTTWARVEASWKPNKILVVFWNNQPYIVEIKFAKLVGTQHSALLLSIVSLDYSKTGKLASEISQPLFWVSSLPFTNCVVLNRLLNLLVALIAS